jgi:glucose/arabinose dehydrogenase
MGQNTPPATPSVTEPQPARLVAPSDAHMETTPFADANAGDTHRCTDWEIWSVSPLERVWVTSCIGGVERLHTHLGDGVFQGALAGRRELDPNTQYRLRVRHRDSSGIAASEWSGWAERDFTTGDLSRLFAMEIKDVLATPVPTLRTPAGGVVDLPVGSPTSVVRLETVVGPLLEVRGRAGGNQIVNPATQASNQAVRVVISAGSTALEIPESNLAFRDDGADDRVVYLPAVSLAAGESVEYWVASNGGTYAVAPGQTTPDFSTLVRGSPVPWTTAPDMRVEVVASGFELPVNIAFVPNPGNTPDSPLYYVTELYGTIKVVRRNGTVSDYATGLLNFNPTGSFPGSGEQGLAGVVVDPANGDLYATLLHSLIPFDDNSPHNPRVVRFTSNDGGLTAATQSVVLNMAPEQQGQSHQISNITFGPDSYLYVHVGDGFDAGAAQNLSQYRGKILRMTRQGQAVTTNPYYNAGNGITARDYIYASGVRNPFGGAWRLSDSSHYFVENGPSIDRFARLVAGRNYAYDGSDQSMRTFALYVWDPATAPVNITFVQPEVFGGSGFPAEYFGRAYVTQSGGTFGSGPGSALYKVITEWVIDATGTLVSGPRPVAYYNGGGQSSAVAIAAGPDGLYFSDFYKEDSPNNPVARGARILRMRYAPPAPPLDCNDNGVPDADDVASGTSSDCNRNGIPDECDIASLGDCNRNGIPDDCDATILVTTDFNNGSTAPFVANGSTRINAGSVRLVGAEQNDTIGTLIRPPLSPEPMTRFSAAFDFRIGGGSGADGMSFAAFDSTLYSNTVLFSEEGPGSPNQAPAGPGTLVVQFDTYDNGGEGENTISIGLNGSIIANYQPSFDLEDFVWRRAEITFVNGELNVRMTNLGTGAVETAFSRLPVPGYQPFVARFGFGGRTGGLSNNHDIDNVTFGVPGPNDRNGNGVPDTCDCPADFNGDFFLDFFDFDEFVLCFDSNTCPADRTGDFNNDGFTDFFDFDDFVTAFEAGC